MLGCRRQTRRWITSGPRPRLPASRSIRSSQTTACPASLPSWPNARKASASSISFDLAIHWSRAGSIGLAVITAMSRTAFEHFMRDGVLVKTVINGMVFDRATKDPTQQAVRDVLIAFMAATADAQALASKEAQKAGIAAAKARGHAYRGRKPSYDRKSLEAVMRMLSQGKGVSIISRATGLSRQAVLRIRASQANAERALSAWGL